jgi:hypothetical protein
MLEFRVFFSAFMPTNIFKSVATCICTLLTKKAYAVTPEDLVAKPGRINGEVVKN